MQPLPTSYSSSAWAWICAEHPPPPPPPPWCGPSQVTKRAAAKLCQSKHWLSSLPTHIVCLGLSSHTSLRPLPPPPRDYIAGAVTVLNELGQTEPVRGLWENHSKRQPSPGHGKCTQSRRRTLGGTPETTNQGRSRPAEGKGWSSSCFQQVSATATKCLGVPSHCTTTDAVPFLGKGLRAIPLPACAQCK